MMAAEAGIWSASIRRAGAARTSTPFLAEVATSWDDAAALWEATLRTGAATPFQQPTWLKATYAALLRGGDASPLLVTLKDAATGAVAMHVPLVMRRTRGMRVIEFADLVSDFNAPILGPAAPVTAEGIAAAWRALRAALPKVDLLRFTKMPVAIDGRPNPLAHARGAHNSAANGNLLVIGEDYDAYRHSLGRTVRKELERSWRVFTRNPLAAFGAVTTADEALRVMKIMEVQQRDRMRSLNVDYTLDDPQITELYRSVVAEGVANGSAVLTQLTAGDELVGALLGIRNRDSYVMVRISHAMGEWSACSPGRLIIERTLALLHAQELRRFDFSIGNYAYKRRFDVERTTLIDVVTPLGWRGVPASARARVAERLRRKPALRAFVRRMLGKPPIREEA
jgi:CelD/BcsL family acetyltransferase involved in cellulose biosynthesis